MTGEWPKKHIDHINGIKADNRFCNLREADDSLNQANRKPAQKNSTGYKGVFFRRDRGYFIAKVSRAGEHFRLGTFPTAELAARAYDEAAAGLFGDHAKLNFSGAKI